VHPGVFGNHHAPVQNVSQTWGASRVGILVCSFAALAQHAPRVAGLAIQEFKRACLLPCRYLKSEVAGLHPSEQAQGARVPSHLQQQQQQLRSQSTPPAIGGSAYPPGSFTGGSQAMRGASSAAYPTK
jgi:hypothetical protein